MIPSDVASRTQFAADAATRPVAATQEISDKLSDLIPGQRLMAEIQSLLPNGTYRAIIAQRNITLALPFSAKPGDALELQVVDSDGKLTLAVISRPPGLAVKTDGEAASTSLSRTGQLISDLFNNVRGRTPSSPDGLRLNGNQPIAAAPPASAGDLLPLLKQAIVQSGMFYESHQAQWVEGQYPGMALLKEPQGKLSTPGETALARLAETPAARFAAAAALFSHSGTAANSAPDTEPSPLPAPTGTASPPTPASEGAASASAFAENPAASSRSIDTNASPGETGGKPAPQAVTDGKPAPQPAPDNPSTAQSASRSAAANPALPPIAPETVPVVQQQLESLATQQFVWQGQVWPGQEMRWEIEEDAKRRSPADETAASWQTRLHLTLPSLGELDARLRLEGSLIQLDLDSRDSGTQQLLRNAIAMLQRQLDDAGLALGQVGFGSLSSGTDEPGASPAVTPHGQAIA